MDLLDLIRRKVEQLPDGPHLQGLRSVLRHIEASYKHLARGQEQLDDSAFTDAIYRTNQAFEGSIKEAYRVLAGKEPSHATPQSIEEYLENHSIFRNRVLAQFTTYRQKWRNPSTHDYTLDFNEDEAFLAIVSVSAFAKVLVDEISKRLAYNVVTADVQSQALPLQIKDDAAPLIDTIALLSLQFLENYSGPQPNVRTREFLFENYTQLLGGLAAYISSNLPKSLVETGKLVSVGAGSLRELDMVVSTHAERIVLELKVSRDWRRSTRNDIARLESSILHGFGIHGICVFYAGSKLEYEIVRQDTRVSSHKIYIIHPKREKDNAA